MSDRDYGKPMLYINSFDTDSIGKYIKELEKIEMTHDPTQPVLLHIDSFGGSVYGMSVLYDKIKSMENPIITYTSSKAMSAGAIILAAAGTPGYRYAAPEADIMIHEIQTGDWGDIKDVEDHHKLNKRINTKWMSILAKAMGYKSGNDIRKLIQEHAIGHNIYLTANKAKELGIVDEVMSIKMEPIHGWVVKKVKR